MNQLKKNINTNYLVLISKMKKIFYFLSTLLFFGLGFFVSNRIKNNTYIQNNMAKNNTEATNDIEITKIKKWYPITESDRHKIFLSDYNTVILDKKLNILLIPDNTCELKIPQNLKNNNSNHFYNSSVGIIRHSPYKTIRYNVSNDIFIQTVANGGCVTEEGRIKLYTDESTETVKCDVEIGYKLLSCY